MTLELIWKQFDKVKISNDIAPQSKLYCKNCRAETGIESYTDILCGVCGLIIDQNLVPYTYDKDNGNNNGQYNKCKYNLYIFVKEYCERLSLSTHYVSLIVDVMTVLFQCTTSKRAKVKEGIFIVCAYFVLKLHRIERSVEELAKNLGVELKYITKGEKLMSQLIQNPEITSKYPIFKNFGDILFSKNDTIDLFYKHSHTLVSFFNLNQIHMDKIRDLIIKCEKVGIVNKASPKSIIVGCIYFYLNELGLGLNKRSQTSKTISAIFNCSAGTVKKIAKEIELKIKELNE